MSRTAMVLVTGLLLAGASVPAVAAPTSAAPRNAGTFVATTPARLMDTRTGLGASAPPARGTAHVRVLGRAGIPSSGVTAVVMTVTVSAPAAHGYLTVWADATRRPTTADVNFSAGRSQADQVYAPVGADGKIAFYNGSRGRVRLLADVAGYFTVTDPAPAGAFVATTPTRVVDTRYSRGASPLGGRRTAAVPVLGRGPVPGTDVSAVAFTLTALSPAARGYLTVFADGTARPATSNLNFAAHQSVGNLVISQVGADGRVDLYNGTAGRIQYVIDIEGYFLGGVPHVPGAYVPVTPTRVLSSSPMAARAATRAAAQGPGVPRNPTPPDAAAASVFNVTASGVTASGYLEAYSSGGRSVGSSLEATPGRVTAGLAVVWGDVLDAFVYNGTPGSLRLTTDLFGYYVSAPGLGSIAGRVTDAAGAGGIGGVQVIAYDLVSNAEGSSPVFEEAERTTTAADGSYVLAHLSAAPVYDVCFDALGVPGPEPSIGYSSECYRDVAWPQPGYAVGDVSGTSVSVSSTATTVVDAQLSRGSVGRVTGRATTADRMGLAGVRVEFTIGGDPDGPVATSVVTTDGSGRFSAELGPGSYEVCFDPIDVPPGTTPFGYATVCAAAPITVSAGSNLLVNQVILASSRITGRVSTSSGHALHDGSVYLVDRQGGHGEAATIRSTGRYTLPILVPGHYFVCVDSPPYANPPYGYLGECHPNSVWDGTSPPGAAATAVSIRAGTSTTLDFTLPDAGAISGTVMTGSGLPVVLGYVDVFDASTGALTDRGYTDDAGRYTAVGLPPSSTGYRVCFDPSHATPSGLTAQCYKGIAWPTGPVPTGTTLVPVRSGAAHRGIDAVLTG
jgi:hypothetical protein